MVDENRLLGRLSNFYHIMRKMNFMPLLLAAAAVAITPLLAINARAAVGDIFETNEGNILRLRAAGSTPGTFSTGLSNPKGIVFDGRGRLFVADAGKSAIIIYSLPDGTGATFATGLSSPVGLAFDTFGNLFVAEAASGNISKLAPEGTKTTFTTGLGGPSGLAFDNSGNLFVADFTAGTILKFTAAGVKSTFATGLNRPAGVAVDSAGNVFASESGSGTIFKFTPDGTKSSFATGMKTPYGLAFDAAGNLIVADNGAGATLSFSPNGTKTTVFQSNFNTPQFVAVEPAPHSLLNVSTRGLVQTGDNILIAGFVVGGTGPVGSNIVVRALGPSLSTLGITNPLADPTLELHDASGAIIASNNDWKDTQEALLTSTTLQPSNDKESAIYISLRGGAFTAVVRGVNSTGTAVVEVYNLE
jgi:sugar lactone lactonase YvrE